jgi:hypothetical protein
MKPAFYPGFANEHQISTFVNISAIKFKSVTGTVKVSFNRGGEITVTTGDTFQSHFPGVFEQVQVTCAAGGSATIISGLGTFSGGGSGAGGTVQSTTGSPEGVVDAGLGQWAYDSVSAALYVNPSSSGNTGWVQLI